MAWATLAKPSFEPSVATIWLFTVVCRQAQNQQITQQAVAQLFK
jgi:hypothetical protein